MTIPKLSDAILLGSTMGPQIRRSRTDGRGGTCAIGAAAVANGLSANDGISALYPWAVESYPSICPACGQATASYAYAIAQHLNDNHEWARERIAAWVATIEPETPSAGENEAEAGQSTNEAEKGLISAL